MTIDIKTQFSTLLNDIKKYDETIALSYEQRLPQMNNEEIEKAYNVLLKFYSSCGVVAHEYEQEVAAVQQKYLENLEVIKTDTKNILTKIQEKDQATDADTAEGLLSSFN
ncbi:MAG: hypothetical protein ACK4NC_02875 [Candidatus Gracilibacteria bacterium]